MAKIDLTGGLAPDADLLMAEAPAPPFDWVREGVSFWLFEESGAFAMPRLGIEAEPHTWNERRYAANFVSADGRVLQASGKGALATPFDAQGRPAILGGGPLTFQCIEPFRTWRIRFDGEAVDTSTSAQMKRAIDPGRKVRLRYELDVTMVTPPNIQDVSPSAFFGWSKGKQRDAVSVGLGLRFEQMLRGEGELSIDGKSQALKAVGSRIKRRSVRTDGLMLRGHCWQAAVFPDGRAFGYEARPVHDDGHEPWNEAFVYQDGRMHYGTVVNPPWLSDIIEKDEDVSLELKTDLGVTRIGGRTALSTFRVGNPDIWGLNLHQGGVLYQWDDQTAYGMIERSSVTGKRA